jgi:hypothetical protein
LIANTLSQQPPELPNEPYFFSSGIKDTDVNRVEIVPVKRSGTEWKMMLPEVIQVMAETVKRTLEIGPAKSGPVSDTNKPDK